MLAGGGLQDTARVQHNGKNIGSTVNACLSDVSNNTRRYGRTQLEGRDRQKRKKKTRKTMAVSSERRVRRRTFRVNTGVPPWPAGAGPLSGVDAHSDRPT